MKWIDRIKRAIKKGEFTVKDERLANKFNTCAIGEKFNMYEKPKWWAFLKEKFGREKANKLCDLGVTFYDKVSDNDTAGAREIYNKIQKLKVK